ncbi:MAG: PhnD/SsuA/transferrin family substrate-binding protein [Cyanobacteria bacterium P01_A01_bin.105]
MLNRRAFLAYGLLALTSCAVAKKTAPPTSRLDRPKQLRFAVTDLSGLETLERDFGQFRQALTDVIAVPIDFFPVENYSAAAPAMLANELDFVMAGPSEYLLLRARAKAVPIVGVTRDHYYTQIMTRIGSGITSLADLKGKTIAMRTEGSTAGHVVPMQMLMDAGLSPQDYTVQMLNKQGVDALRSGQVDAWADSFSRYLELVKTPGLEGVDIEVIASSDPLPPDLFLANPSLGAPLIAELRSQMLHNTAHLLTALSASEANAKYLSSAMVAVQDTDYQALRDSYYAIGQGSAIE